MNPAKTKESSFDSDNKWLKNELQYVDLGDKRLNERLHKTSYLMDEKVSASINRSCKEWSLSKGAYRLFSNEKFDEEEVYASHGKETCERVEGNKTIFCIQDTTYLDYDSHKKTQGLGSIGKSHLKHIMGLIVHTALLTTMEGLPLGISSQECWARPAREDTSAKERDRRRYNTPAKNKESYKWTAAVKRTKQIVPEGTKVITLGDRESDIFRFLSDTESMGASYVVRNRASRNFICPETGKTDLQTRLKELTVKKTMVLEIHKKGMQEARKAKVKIKYTYGYITIRPPDAYRSSDQEHKVGDKIGVYVVSVKEEKPLKDAEGIDWVLLTNVPVNSTEDAIERIKWYKLRWRIEEFFKVLKSGCKIEEARLSTKERLQRFIAIKSILAFKILYLSKMALLCPNAPCTKILSSEEWKTLYIREHKVNKLPEKLPTIKQVAIWIGKLGGFLNRKGDKLPGTITLWRGYENLQENIQLYAIFNPNTCG